MRKGGREGGRGGRRVGREGGREGEGGRGGSKRREGRIESTDATVTVLIISLESPYLYDLGCPTIQSAC